MKFERILRGFIVITIVMFICAVLIFMGTCNTTYTKTAEVYSTVYNSNGSRTTEFIDDDGNIWAFAGNSFSPDAVYELVINNNGTRDVGDDIITSVKVYGIITETSGGTNDV